VSVSVFLFSRPLVEYSLSITHLGDMSKPFDTPFEDWSIVNCMLPTRYYPPFQNNIYEKLTASIARQLFPDKDMTKDYDQFLNKRPGKTDAIFSWHSDMNYWPSSKVLGIDDTTTCTFSLAIDDSTIENGCLRYIPGSQLSRTIRPHVSIGKSRDDAHALTIEVDESKEKILYAPAKRGSVTVHDEYVVHGSSGNNSRDKERRTYVLAYRSKDVVDAERRIGFTHSHNDAVNWDTFDEILSAKE
jgi:phytanoyl-CoA hydroxylase